MIKLQLVQIFLIVYTLFLCVNGKPAVRSVGGSAGESGKRLNRLGLANNYHWAVNKTYVAWHIENPDPILLTLKTEDQTVEMDVHRTAVVVVDMQNDFCSKDGWFDANGADISKTSAPIKPIVKLVPKMRSAGFKIIWVTCNIRPDFANFFPVHFWVVTHSGDGVGFGAETSTKIKGTKVLEKGTWGTQFVDEIQKIVQPEDIIVEKQLDSAFWNTDMNAILRNLDMKNLIFMGVATDQCVLFSMADAHFNGYGGIVVRDCVGTHAPDYVDKAAFWQIKNSFGFVTSSDHILQSINEISRDK